jgi:hypothetical protein
MPIETGFNEMTLMICRAHPAGALAPRGGHAVPPCEKYLPAGVPDKKHPGRFHLKKFSSWFFMIK